MVNSKTILHHLSLNKRRFEEGYYLIRSGIFGSFARGDNSKNSDIDLIVEFKENTPDLFSIKQKLKG